MRAVSEILTRGEDVLNSWDGFKLVGRDRELRELASVLMRMRKRNLVVTGRPGVGISSIVLGLFASKNDVSAPLDIVSKRFYWLSTDHLFESGSAIEISEAFRVVRQTLSARKDNVLVIEDTLDFSRAAKNNGCLHLVHGLMADIKSDKYQAIFETNDDGLGEVLAMDSDVAEYCSLYELKEPDAENLRIIIEQSKASLEKHHGIELSEAALETAVALTEKYKLSELRAQPDAASSLLDQSLTDFIQRVHHSPVQLAELEQRIRREENERARKKLLAELSEKQNDWRKRQEAIRKLYTEISDGEAEVIRLEDRIQALREEQKNRVSALSGSAESDPYAGHAHSSETLKKVVLPAPQNVGQIRLY